MTEPTYTVMSADGKVKRTVKLFEVIAPSDIWVTKSNVKIISLTGLQKIAAAENIVEKKFELIISPTKENYQSHGVNIWLGYRGDANPDGWIRGTGEASKLNTGKYKVVKGSHKDEWEYQEIGQIDSMYRLAMAEKRAYGRALIKMIHLFGYYSDVDSPDFTKAEATEDLSNGSF